MAELIDNYNCVIDGIQTLCSFVDRNRDAYVECPDNDCGRRQVRVDITYRGGGRQSFAGWTSPFSAYGDGRSGFRAGGKLLPDGYSLTLRGAEAQRAAESFAGGMNFRGQFGDGLFNVFNLLARTANFDRGSGQQKPLTDPAFLKSENKAGGCSILVNFRGKFDESHPNGPGPYKVFGVPTHGLGFTATVSVAGGGVSRIGLDFNISNPSGAWTINQIARSTAIENGRVYPPRNAPYDVGNYSFEGGATLEQNPITGATTYTWHDHPGYAVEGVNSFSGNYSFLIEAKNKQTGAMCVVGFRMELTFSRQKGWAVHWGR